MKSQLSILILILVAFSVYTFAVVFEHGYTGFLILAWNDAWGGQVFIDLVIALTLFLVWMLGDAREEGLPALPYAALILTTGSIGALAYLVHRTARRERLAPASV